MHEACAHTIEMEMERDGTMHPVNAATTNRSAAAADILAVNDTTTLRKMMRGAFETGNHGKVIEILTHLISLEPQNERNFFNRHKSYIHGLRYDEAIADLTSALKLRPGYKQALAQRARINRIAGYCENSVNDYKALKDMDPKHPDLEELSRAQSCVDALTNAKKLFNQNDYTGARDLYDDILLHTEANHAPILTQRALCSWNLKEWSDVVFDAGRLLQLLPDSIQGLTLRGFAFYNLGDTEMAITHFREALKFDPENKECKDAYRKLRKIVKTIKYGREKLKVNDFMSASHFFQEAASLAENGKVAAPLMLEIARAQSKMKEWKACAKAAKSAVEFDDGLLDAHMLLGEAYTSLEKYQDAVYAYTKASQIDPNNGHVANVLRNAEVALAQSKKTNYYKILEVRRNAETVEIKKSYKRLALLWHPDKHAGKPDEERDEAEEKFQKVSEAYEVLGNIELRRKYDNGEEVFENQGHGGGHHHHHQQHFHFSGHQQRRQYYYHR